MSDWLSTAGSGGGTSSDAEQTAEELGYSFPGLPPPHLFRQRCLPGMRGGGTAHYGENGKPIFQLEYKD